jgi:hypothetical protein
MFDAAIHRDSMMMLKAAPVSMFMFGYWVLGNPEVFRNFHYEIKYMSEPASH